MVRRVLGITTCVARQIISWILSVFVLAAIPIGLHLATILARGEMAELPLDELSDGYLYTFIIAMTAFTDTLADRRQWPDRKNTALAAVFVALVAALGYPTSSVPEIMKSHLGPWLQATIWPLLGVFLIAYCFYKLPILVGAGKGDWAEAERIKAQKGTTNT